MAAAKVKETKNQRRRALKKAKKQEVSALQTE
jgi:hypothetical protein